MVLFGFIVSVPVVLVLVLFYYYLGNSVAYTFVYCPIVGFGFGLLLLDCCLFYLVEGLSVLIRLFWLFDLFTCYFVCGCLLF